eukprot:Sdes_comp18633_c0_seq1m8825
MASMMWFSAVVLIAAAFAPCAFAMHEIMVAPGVWIRDFVDTVPESCTTTVTGRNASASGAPMVTYTNDCKECDSRISRVPARTYSQGEKRKVIDEHAEYPRYVGTDRGTTYMPEKDQALTPTRQWIDQVNETFAYIDGSYAIMNQYGLGIGESTCNSRIKVTNESAAYFTVAELSRIAMERCKTARCAVELMGKLAFEYGFYEPENCGGETLTVIDSLDAWVFHVSGTPDGKSAVWVARRVPEDSIVAIGNFFTIGELFLEDTDNYLASSNVFQVAEDLGFWKKGDRFHFGEVYGGPNKMVTYTARRVWRVYDLVAPSLHLNPVVQTDHEYPWSVRPDQPIDFSMLAKINRDHFEGTPFDLSKGLGAGPWGTPTRVEFRPKPGQPMFERPICLARTAYSIILESRPNLPPSVGGLTWFGSDAPHSSCYLPIYAGSKDVPKPVATGRMHEFSTDSAWWAFDFLSNYILDSHYSKMIPFVREAQNKYEKEAQQKDLEIISKVQNMTQHGESLEQIEAFLGNMTSKWADVVVKAWWELSGYLAVKYNDNFNNIPKVGTPEPYNDEWMTLLSQDLYKQSHPVLSKVYESMVPAFAGVAVGILTCALVYAVIMNRRVAKRAGYQPVA